MYEVAVIADMLDGPGPAARQAGQPCEDLARHRAVEVDAGALGAGDNLAGAGWGEETPLSVLGGVTAGTGLLTVTIERNDLLDTHAAEDVQHLAAHANRIQQVAGLHGGPPEAGL